MILATPNYGFEKRQRELAKKQKKEAKRLKKAAAGQPTSSGEQADPPAPGTPAVKGTMDGEQS